MGSWWRDFFVSKHQLVQAEPSPGNFGYHTSCSAVSLSQLFTWKKYLDFILRRQRACFEIWREEKQCHDGKPVSHAVALGFSSTLTQGADGLCDLGRVTLGLSVKGERLEQVFCASLPFGHPYSVHSNIKVHFGDRLS